MNQNQRISLAEKNLKVLNLAEILERHPKYIYNVLSAKEPQYKCEKMRKQIADVLDRSVRYLWPEDTDDV